MEIKTPIIIKIGDSKKKNKIEQIKRNLFYFFFPVSKDTTFGIHYYKILESYSLQGS